MVYRVDDNGGAVQDVVSFFNDTATTEIYTLSLHDALPIFVVFKRHIQENTWKGFYVYHVICD